MRPFDTEKIRRLERAKQQRILFLRGEMIIPWRDLAAKRVVRIADYKARKARQVVWKNESTAGIWHVQ